MIGVLLSKSKWCCEVQLCHRKKDRNSRADVQQTAAAVSADMMAGMMAVRRRGGLTVAAMLVLWA